MRPTWFEPKNLIEKRKLEGERLMARRPMGTAVVADRRAVPSDELGYEWYRRFVALREKGLLPPLLTEAGKFYLAGGPCARWEGKRLITIPQLRDLIERLESGVVVEAVA